MKRQLEITYPNGDSEGLLVSRVEDGNLFRLEESSLLEDAFYGDIVELLPTGENTGAFQKVVSRSGLKVLRRIISKEIQNSPKLQPLLERIMQLGGNWERALGGVLFVHLPDSVDFNLDKELKAIHDQPE
jgi:hypothetical protein